MPERVLVVGGTGTIGRATLHVLLSSGYDVVCFGRRSPDVTGVTWRPGDVTRPELGGECVDAVISCLASRTGVPADAWAIDHRANRAMLDAARRAGARHFVLLSAICVQKPRLAFQHAKLAFEAELAASGIRYSIIRPTAYFKSLSGQIERLRRGKPFLLFGDGRITACKPISDSDLARYLVDCLEQPARWNQILPVGGPGPALTPREMGERLFALLGQPPKFRSVPPALLGSVAMALRLIGLRQKSELARIGQYYATESMLVWDERAGRYDASATPETGSQTLYDFYAHLIATNTNPDRAEHAIF